MNLRDNFSQNTPPYVSIIHNCWNIRHPQCKD